MDFQPFKYHSSCSIPPTKHYHQRFVIIEFLDGTWLLKKDRQVWSKNPDFFDDINNIYDENVALNNWYIWDQSYGGTPGWNADLNGYQIEDIPGPFGLKWIQDAGALRWHYNPPENLFEGFIIERYGKGYSLKPPQGHRDIGVKYYYHAWWQTKNKQWFLKKEFRDFFIKYGATFNLGKDFSQFHI